MRSIFASLAAAGTFFATAVTSTASILDDISGIVYHLDAGAGLTLSGNSVLAWESQSVGGLTFAQSTVVKQPTFISASASFNDLPVIRFDGDLTGNTGGVAPNADELVLSVGTTVQTIVIVNRTLQHRNLDGVWGDEAGDIGLRRANASNWQHPGNPNDFSNGGAMFINGTATTAAGLNTPVIVFATRSSAVAFNDTSIGDYFQVGVNTPRSWNGEIAELAVYDRALTESERTQIESYLGAKYNIAVVPEPVSMAMLALGALAVCTRRCRRG